MARAPQYNRGTRHFCVMDGRANSDMDAATVLEHLGRHKPNWLELGRRWGDQGAVLVVFEEKRGDPQTLVNGRVIGPIR